MNWQSLLFWRREQGDSSTPPPPTTRLEGTKSSHGRDRLGSTTHHFTRSELPEVSPEHAYGYGKTDGRRGNDSHHYRRYVGWTGEEARLTRLLREADERLESAHARFLFIRDLLPNIAERGEKRRQAVERETALATEREAVEQQMAELEAEQRRTANRGSLFSGTLYFAVAIVFVLADVVVARQIVADALQFTGGTFLGVDESWLFAFGLAFIAVLLKPVYDRLVEEKYHDGSGRAIYAWVMISVGAFALATLFVMGAFRAEAFGLQTQVDSLIRSGGTPEAIRTAADALVGSRLGAWSNVLSGMLFAVAGAVSLGMGSRHFQDFWQIRRRIVWRLRELGGRLQRLRSLATSMRDQAGTLAAEMSRLSLVWAEAPQLSTLADEVERCRRERDSLLARTHAATREKLVSVYSDGYGYGYIGDGPAERLGSEDTPHRSLRRSLYLSHLRQVLRTEDGESEMPWNGPFEPGPGDWGGGRSRRGHASAPVQALRIVGEPGAQGSDSGASADVAVPLRQPLADGGAEDATAPPSANDSPVGEPGEDPVDREPEARGDALGDDPVPDEDGANR